MSTTAEAAIQPSVAEGVLRVPHTYVNWYLLDDADGVTIVDAGPPRHPRHWALLPRALERIGRRLDDVRALVLTHGHYDHVGFAERVRTELRIPVYAPRGEGIYRPSPRAAGRTPPPPRAASRSPPPPSSPPPPPSSTRWRHGSPPTGCSPPRA